MHKMFSKPSSPKIKRHNSASHPTQPQIVWLTGCVTLHPSRGDAARKPNPQSAPPAPVKARARATHRQAPGSPPARRSRSAKCHGSGPPSGESDGEPPPRTRLKYLSRRLHELGPKPLFHFLDEVERGAELRAHLEEYAELPGDLVKAYRGDQFMPEVFLLREGRL